MYQNLRIPEQLLVGLLNKTCTVCGVHVEKLKRNALLALQTANFAPLVTKGIMAMNSNQGKHLDMNESSAPTTTTSSQSECADGVVNGQLFNQGEPTFHYFISKPVEEQVTPLFGP